MDVNAMIRDYADMLLATGRKKELKNVPWLVPTNMECKTNQKSYHKTDSSKVTPDLEKKMRRELIAHKRQTQC